MPYDRDIFFGLVRNSLFSGEMSQSQVDGMNSILRVCEYRLPYNDHRWLAYALATTYHETSQEMQPIEEYGKGEGMEYGTPDPETGQTYYGRGFVQLTWRENYQRATTELQLPADKDLVWHAAKALDLIISARVMFQGMIEAWFRPPNDLAMYFNDADNDAYGAREIINGDKTKVPSWSGGVSIGNLIKGYHEKFLDALQESYTEREPIPILRPPDEPSTSPNLVSMTIAQGVVNIVVKRGASVIITDENDA